MTELHVIPGELLPPHVPPRRHLLSVADLSRDDVERLLATARSFALSQERDNKKLPTLRGRLVLNLFYESSTRTSSSFELAAKRLSADTLAVKSAGSRACTSRSSATSCTRASRARSSKRCASSARG